MLENIILFLNTRTPLFYLTQPVWRDEAFSALLALKSPLEIIKLTTIESNPPAYFLILHFWIKVFGCSEIAIRALSFIFYSLTVAVIYKFSGYFAEKFQILNSKFQIFSAAIAALNPMLIYYAFEARSYSLLAFLSIISIYAFFTNRKKLNMSISALGLYTHYYFAFVIIVQIIYSCVKLKKTAKGLLFLFAPFMFFIPWLPFVKGQILSASSKSWYFPVDLQMWLASLGTLFTGFTGTPPFIWKYHKILSLVILIASVSVLNKNRREGFFLFLLTALPAFIILSISFFKPAWYNRYFIYSTLAIIITLAIFIFQLPKYARALFLLSALGFSTFFNIWFPPYIAKKDYKTPILALKRYISPSSLIVADDPIHFLETQYYFLNASNPVKVLSPIDRKIPSYIGSAIIKSSDIIEKLPKDKDVYIISKDGSINIKHKRVN